MTWFASSVNEAEAEKEHYLMFLAVLFDFPSGLIGFWSGLGDLSINGQAYIGMGALAGASMVMERSNLAVDRKTYRLTGLPEFPLDPSVVSEADLDGSFGRPVVEYLGFLNPDTHLLLDTPEINFEGEISNCRRVFGKTQIIEINVEDRNTVLDQVDGWRYTHEHQQDFFPSANDLGFNQVPKMGLKTLMWGARPVPSGEGSGPGNRQRGPGRGR